MTACCGGNSVFPEFYILWFSRLQNEIFWQMYDEAMPVFISTDHGHIIYSIITHGLIDATDKSFLFTFLSSAALDVMYLFIKYLQRQLNVELRKAYNAKLNKAKFNHAKL